LLPIEIEVATFDMEVFRTKLSESPLAKAILDAPGLVCSRAFAVHGSVWFEDCLQQVKCDLVVFYEGKKTLRCRGVGARHIVQEQNKVR
jgi:hypothetical protein